MYMYKHKRHQPWHILLTISILIKARVDLLSHFAKCKNKVSNSDILQEIDFGTITIDLEIKF